MSSPKICPQCGAEYESDQRFCPKDGTTLRLQNATGDLVGSIVADRYHVLRKLGEGGMGQVYLAEHVKMGRKSALKVMNPAMVKDADAISRFNREAANASHINHPNVADVYDFGETSDGIIYLAMEFVDGAPLTKLIEHEGPLPPVRAATIIRQAAEALAVAHEMGIVHRDLKPDNIMIARGRDDSDVVKVVDFGIAKAADNVAQKVTKTGHVIGTPEYMSPEQLAGDKLDGRSDVYSLGLVAFNMLTGRLPFPADTVQESMIMRLTEAPRKLAEMRPEVAWPEDVQAALDKALQRYAGARYQTATEFARSLSEALERMPRMRGATARRPSGPRPKVAGATRGSLAPTRVAGQAPSATEPPVRRRRQVVAVSAGSVILIAALSGTAIVFRRDSGRSAARDSVTPAGNATSQKGLAESAHFVQPLDSMTVRGRGRSETGGVGGGAATVPVDVKGTLDSLETVVSGQVSPNEAARVLRAVEEMKHRIKGNEQLVQAAVINALAEGSRHDNRAACRALRQVRAIAPGTSRAKMVANAMSLSC